MAKITLKAAAQSADLRYGGWTIIGAREAQQDSAGGRIDRERALFTVCDGMGGMDDGGKASTMTVSLLEEAFDQRNPDQPMPDFFRRVILAINDRVSDLKDSSGKRLNTGSTATAAAVLGNRLYWLSVGDSRIYIIRGDNLVQVNREHNFRMRLKEHLEEGLITQEQYDAEENTRKAEALISYIGIPELKLMEINESPFLLERGDYVLLCSDGLYKSLSDDQIFALIRDNDIDLNIAADRLCQMALRYGGNVQDNTTVLLFQYLPSGQGAKEV